MNTQLGLGEETTVGTGVTVSRFYDLDVAGESIKQSIDRIENQGLRSGGRRMLGSNNWVPGKVGVAGDVALSVMNKGFGVIFKHCLGAVATSTPGGATLTRDHKCTVGPTDGKGLTIQLGRTDNTGTTQAFTYTGCKVNQWELSNDTSGMLMLKLTVDGQAETTATGLATASYPTGLLPFAYTKGVITVGGTELPVTDYTLTGDNGLATDRYFIRSSTPASKKEQLEGGQLREYGGNIGVEWSGLTDYNRFVNGTTATVVLTYTSTVAIEATFFPTITVTLDTVRFDGETPVVTGPEILKQSIPFKVLDAAATDGPCVVTVRTSDTTP